MDAQSLGLHHVTRLPRVETAAPYPTLVLLHGRGADERDLLTLADQLDPHLLIVSVRAPHPLDQGFEWYRLINIGHGEPTTFAESLVVLHEFLARLPRLYPVDPNRLGTLGFSQGAVMASAVLLTRPETLAGTVMLSGYLPLDQNLPIDEARLAHRPVFVAHGTADPLIPITWGRATRDFFSRVGADLTYREYPIAHYIAPEELRDVAEWLRARITPRPGAR